MKRNKRQAPVLTRILLAVSVVLCMLGASACGALGKGGGSDLVFCFTSFTADGAPAAWARTDLDISVVSGGLIASGEVFMVPSATLPNGLPIYGPVQAEAGFRYVHWRTQSKRWKLKLDEPLPAACARLFRPGEATALRVTFEEVSPAPPAP